MEYNCALIKVDCLAACIALKVVGDVPYILFLPALAYNLLIPPAYGKQGPIPEELSQTQLTNKKQGNMN